MDRSATHSLLTILAAHVVAHVCAQCPDPFLSEIVEGTGDTTAIEIYNPSTDPIDMSAYVIRSFPNGSVVTVGFVQLSGMLAPGAVVSVTGAELAFYGVEMNGDDALSLEWLGTVPPYDRIVDVFGQPGLDPGAGWTADADANYTDAGGATPWTKDHTLVRKATVTQGLHTCCPSPFNVTLEWDTLPVNTVSGIGSHTMVPCGSTSVHEAINGQSTATLAYLDASTAVITSPRPMESVRVLDVQGRVLRLLPLSSSKQATIDPHVLPPGFNVLEVRYSGGEPQFIPVVNVVR